jgi:hypothetical protein
MRLVLFISLGLYLLHGPFTVRLFLRCELNVWSCIYSVADHLWGIFSYSLNISLITNGIVLLRL